MQLPSSLKLQENWPHINRVKLQSTLRFFSGEPFFSSRLVFYQFVFMIFIHNKKMVENSFVGCGGISREIAQSPPSFFSLSASLKRSSNSDSSEMTSVMAFMKASCGVYCDVVWIRRTNLCSNGCGFL